jgi:hypothetical protein
VAKSRRTASFLLFASFWQPVDPKQRLTVELRLLSRVCRQMDIPPDAEPEHYVHDSLEHDAASDDEATVDPTLAKSRFQRYRTSIEQRCGARPRATDRFMPRQPQKIAP